MDFRENGYCAALCVIVVEGKKKTFLIKKGYLSNFHKNNCELKFYKFYIGVQKEDIRV